MFQKGDTIVYGSQGVCKVESVGELDISLDKSRLYYTLIPVFMQDTRFYVPIDIGENNIRYLLSADEAEKLIDIIPEIEAAWIINEKEREQQYKAAIRSSDCIELVRIIKTLYERKNNRIKDGKKITAVDEKYFRIAKEHLFGELAVSLNKSKDYIEEYIKERISSHKLD